VRRGSSWDWFVTLPRDGSKGKGKRRKKAGLKAPGKVTLLTQGQDDGGRPYLRGEQPPFFGALNVFGEYAIPGIEKAGELWQPFRRRHRGVGATPLGSAQGLRPHGKRKQITGNGTNAIVGNCVAGLLLFPFGWRFLGRSAPVGRQIGERPPTIHALTWSPDRLGKGPTKDYFIEEIRYATGTKNASQ